MCACAVCIRCSCFDLVRMKKYEKFLSFWSLIMQNLKSFWGFAPDPNGGAYSAPPYPLPGAGGGNAPSRTHPLWYRLLNTPPLTDNPGSATAASPETPMGKLTALPHTNPPPPSWSRRGRAPPAATLPSAFCAPPPHSKSCVRPWPGIINALEIKIQP